MYQLVYYPRVVSDDIPRLPKHWKEIIKEAISTKLQREPLLFGVPLRSSLKGFRKLRVGDYRVVFLVVKNEVRIVAIAHRREVYEKIISKRLP
jgi:mRNA interferase RelE/StbE